MTNSVRSSPCWEIAFRKWFYWYFKNVCFDEQLYLVVFIINKISSYEMIFNVVNLKILEIFQVKMRIWFQSGQTCSLET